MSISSSSSSSSSTSVLVFLDIPPKTFIGINLSSFNTSPDFVGVFNIPPGLHFVYSGTDASLSIRNGRWLQINTVYYGEVKVIVLKWDPDTESTELLDDQSETTQAITRSLQRFQKRGLVDYQVLRNASARLQAQSQAVNAENEFDPWPRLTTHISSHLLDRVLSKKKKDAENVEVTGNAWGLTSISSSPTDTERIPGLSLADSNATLSSFATLQLLPINLKQTWPDHAVGRERTEAARDRSWYLKQLIETIYSKTTTVTVFDKQAGAREILGELQFCFIMVLTLANYSCLEQWKRILNVLFTCETALKEVEGYFVEAVKVFRQQIERVEDVEGGLFEMNDEQSSAWLRKLLRLFRRNVDESTEGEQTALTKQLRDLEDWLRDRYGWEDQGSVLRKGMIQLEDGEMVEMQMTGFDEEEETGEYAPTIVEV